MIEVKICSNVIKAIRRNYEKYRPRVHLSYDEDT